METFEILWNQVLEQIDKTVSRIAIDTYINRLKPVDVQGTKLILSVSTATYANTIANNYLEQIRHAISLSNTGLTDIEIHIGDSTDDFLALNGFSASDDVIESTPIDPKYTFDSFVVGSSNKFLYNAAKAVANNPGDAFNPLFIYGDSGLGKTHIMNAIANYVKNANPKMNILYATCEKFTNDLVASIRRGKGEGQNFRDKYRNVDMLIIDDVQFLSRKQSTQEEFFHTFNELYCQGKQIVLSADCQPKDIELLEQRLITRFEGGLMAQVLPPDIETKIAILQRKAEEKKHVLSFEVASFIAENSDNDVRSLEGMLNKVIFASMLKEQPITVALAIDAIKDSSTTDQKEAFTMEDIIDTVCNFFKISRADLTGKKKNKEIVEPRQICIYLITEFISVPLVKIGQIMGGRDHTTVMHSRDKVAEDIKTNPVLATTVSNLKNLILKK